MTYFVEPYLFWKGHYKQYFENLLDKSNSKYIYCNNHDMNYNNSIYLEYSHYEYENSFIDFIKSRVINAFKTINKLNKLIKENDTIYFLEFEPFSSLYFSFINRNKKIKIIQTIHSIERMRYSNKFKDLISRIQRFIFKIALRRISQFNITYVVHYQYHKDALREVVGIKPKIEIIDYPSPNIKVKSIKPMSKEKTLLIFGLVREDKGIYEFLREAVNFDLKITIAGKVIDNRVKDFEKNFTFIDKFLSETEIYNLYTSHDFALIPYGSSYTGGAGPLKDAFAYGKFVVVSDHKVFNSLVLDSNLGIVFKSLDDLVKKLSNISSATYKDCSNNCLNYARKNTWTNMKIKYFEIK